MTRSAPSIMIVAGEASGDVYGARLVDAFRTLHPETRFFGIGGDKMRAAGMELLYHIDQTAVMGFVEVVKRYPFFREMLDVCHQQYRQRRPDVVVLIDYPGFNLRLARKVKKAGGRVLYYISPQVWAWGKDRGEKMRGLVDHLACVFPFEKPLFDGIGIPTTYVGHPLVEILGQVDRSPFLAKHALPDDRPLLGLFPGSRVQEVQRLLPVMLAGARMIREECDCTIAIGAAGIADELYVDAIGEMEDVHLLRDATHGLMQHSHAAVVASGTATVETALYETPMVIVYRASWLNYQIGRRLINVNHIGMVNILAGRRIVPELLQDDVQAEYIAEYMHPYFKNPKQRADTIAQLREVKALMGEPGASMRTAELLDAMLGGKTQ
jgi:lipid-A-disaccharide synthase